MGYSVLTGAPRCAPCSIWPHRVIASHPRCFSAGEAIRNHQGKFLGNWFDFQVWRNSGASPPTPDPTGFQSFLFTFSSPIHSKLICFLSFQFLQPRTPFPLLCVQTSQDPRSRLSHTPLPPGGRLGSSHNAVCSPLPHLLGQKQGRKCRS